MNHNPPPLESLPNAKIEAIKDGGRNITSRISREKGLAEKVGANLRILLSPEADKASLDQGVLGAITRIAREERGQIIELLQDKECMKKIAGASKREKAERQKLAEKVLDEIAGKIQLHMSHIPATDDGSIPEETATDKLFRDSRH